ncbi:MAG TPA: polyphosphate kinase 1 [Candidatus Gemmiger excrementipullorum]|uniref:Polyphosphate kinase n=1 Tax=Candidatus Gemmiger excrementipullorum TaxID=2838610 RepID=A0A9D1Y1U9_9FIRM|nr:polyphosphate kinase 1 [Candidatus Gemmiger excrementipullorum]
MDKPETIYINRELSWLDFDNRVLALAKEKNVPLGERIKFAAIFGSNMDEFFMVRVGSLYDQTLLKNNKPDIVTHMTASEQIAAITPRVAELQAKCDKYYQHLIEQLAAAGYKKVDFNKLTKQQEHFWKAYFQRELMPLLSPQIVDARHPFPFLNNKDIYYIAQLFHKGEGVSFGIVPVSDRFERVMFIKDGDATCFAFIEELVARYAATIFNASTVQKQCLFRVTRNADITVDEGMMDHDIDFRDVMSELLKKRRKLAAVRLQFWPEAPQEIVKFLREKLVVPSSRCYTQTSPLDSASLFKLAGRIAGDGSHAEMFYPAAKPMQAPAGYDLYTEVRKHDVLLAYPYQSIRPFIRMLQRAGSDPDVVSIKMTLYRMASDSQIVAALINAAENGKEVVAMVELRARFDEQNNIDWSKQLQDAGCTVLYGFDDYKVHSKLTLITSRVNGKYHYLTQIGTGNYNEKTSEQYTDLSFITTRQEIGEEASAVFNNMALQRLTSDVGTMLVAPLHFKTVLLEEMDRQIARAMQGQEASIILKNNSINDPQIMAKIIEASCAGVRVDMIVRGICCVRAGVPGYTENVHIRSIVGRYLEHSRIYCFGSGEDMRIYIASGDFLTRNTERRVEVGVRVDDAAIAKKLRGILDLQLRDTVNAREMQPDGTYTKVKPAEGQPPVDSQMAMFGYFQNSFAAPEPPKPAKTPEPPRPAAPKAVAKPVNRKTSPLRPSRPGLWQNLFGRGSGKK